MSELERPPLERRVFEQIEIMQHVVDQQHWRIIAGFVVDAAEKRNPPLLIPRTPMNLLGALQAYASMLFKCEADQYGQFQQNPNYAPWLEKVEDRVIARVFRTIAAMEEASKPASLGYHGLTDDEITQGLGRVLFEIRNSYIWTVPPSESPRALNLTIDASYAAATPSVEPEVLPMPPQMKESRDELRALYLAQFPNVLILDICWAARQHYSEWKRWLRGVVKDGSAPDRAFQSLLKSGKSPREYRREPRPDGWK